MIDPIEVRMLKSRIRLLVDQPFFGQIMMHLDIQEASGWCATAATDGKHLFYNRDFVAKLNDDELLFLHGHEVLHVVLDHVFRRGDRKVAIWNMAIDYICNYILVKAKIGQMPKSGLYDPKYTDAMSSEELYDLLNKTIKTIQQPLDVHFDSGQTDSGDGGQIVESDDDRPQISKEDAAEIRETMRSIVAQAITQTAPGDMPAGLRRILDRLLAPKINWRHMLAKVLRSTIKYDYTYTRLSRRTWSNGLILPGQDVEDRVEATAWLDGSASTTQQMITDFLKECKGIMQTFRDFELRIGTFDTKVYNVQIFTPANASEIDRYVFHGNGGTRPSCCWEYMKQHRIRPARVILFTDGYVGNDWGDPNYADTLFIVHGNPDIAAPYGRTVFYEN